jgi:adsorption protein B
MVDAGTFLWLLDVVTRELMLFAAVGLLIGGIDDLLIDLIWIARIVWRRIFIYSRHEPATAATLRSSSSSGRIAIFIGAWDESAVIGQMLRTALGRFDYRDYRIYVGVYPNDPATIAAVAAVAAVAGEDDRVRMVGGWHAGPTTKAECLNRLWMQLQHDELVGIMYQTHQMHRRRLRTPSDRVRLSDRRSYRGRAGARWRRSQRNGTWRFSDQRSSDPHPFPPFSQGTCRTGSDAC